MYVVFWTEQSPLGDAKDHYCVGETRSEAEDHYADLLTKPNIYAAGYGPISQGTEPQWIDSETNANTPIKEKELKRK